MKIIMAEYIVTDMALRILRGVAKLRAESFPSKAHCKSSKVWSRGDASIEERSLIGNLVGVVGEYYFAKAVGGFFDPVSQERGDGNAPDVMCGERGVAVKTATYWPPILKVDGPERIEQSDDVALCYFNRKRQVIVVGMLTVEQFLREQYEHDFGHGKAMCYNFNLTGERP